MGPVVSKRRESLSISSKTRANHSKDHNSRSIEQQDSHEGVSAVMRDKPVPELTEREKELIKHTWRRVEKDAESVGAVSFVNLFEMHPNIKDEFIPFKSIDVDDARYNKILRNHGLKVLNTISKMINRFEEPHKMTQMCKAVGTRHGGYNVNARLIHTMCPHFVKAIEGTLPDIWNAELSDAYTHMFDILAYNMKNALLKAQAEQEDP